MAQLPCVSSPRPLLAMPAGRWCAGVRARPNAAGAGAGWGRLRAAAARPVATAVQAEQDDGEEEVVVEERYALGGACRVLAGMPAPLGATALHGGVNFAVYSSGASAASLCLFTPDDLKAVSFPHSLLNAISATRAAILLCLFFPFLNLNERKKIFCLSFIAYYSDAVREFVWLHILLRC